MSPSSAAASRSDLLELWEEADRIMCAYPELQLRVCARPDGMHLRAVLWLPGQKVGRPYIVLQKAVWQPREVTEVSVVDWGRRALAKWLEEQLVSSAE